VPGKVPRGSFQRRNGGSFTALGRIIVDKLDRGVILIDDRGHVLDANALASSVLGSGDGIRIRARRFAFKDPQLDERFQQLIAARKNAPGEAAPAIAVHVKRESGDSYRVVLSSVPESADARPTAFFALIYPSNANRQISPDVLKQLYGLTPAQADVARSLFSGRSVEETATLLGLSLNTVRTHLKHIFTRCEVQSQAELLHLLALGPHTL